MNIFDYLELNEKKSPVFEEEIKPLLLQLKDFSNKNRQKTAENIIEKTQGIEQGYYCVAYLPVSKPCPDYNHHIQPLICEVSIYSPTQVKNRYAVYTLRFEFNFNHYSRRPESCKWQLCNIKRAIEAGAAMGTVDLMMLNHLDKMTLDEVNEYCQIIPIQKNNIILKLKENYNQTNFSSFLTNVAYELSSSISKKLKSEFTLDVSDSPNEKLTIQLNNREVNELIESVRSSLKIMNDFLQGKEIEEFIEGSMYRDEINDVLKVHLNDRLKHQLPIQTSTKNKIKI